MWCQTHLVVENTVVRGEEQAEIKEVLKREEGRILVVGSIHDAANRDKRVWKPVRATAVLIRTSKPATSARHSEPPNSRRYCIKIEQ